jgi:aminoglycoside phosphotransferase
LEGVEDMNNFQKPIAVGRTAEVYPFDNGKVLKLFFPTIPQLWIDKEVDTGRYIQDAQLPVPKVYEKVKLNDREGMVYERIEGPSLLNELAKKPWKVVQPGVQ